MGSVWRTEPCGAERLMLVSLSLSNVSFSVLSLEESVKAMSLSAEEDDIPWESLRDNRDLTVFASWDPTDRQLTEEHRRQSLEEESVWLRIRSLTLRCLAALAVLGHTPSQQNSEISNENGVGDKTSVLSGLLSQLNQTLQTAVQRAEKRVQVTARPALKDVSHV